MIEQELQQKAIKLRDEFISKRAKLETEIEDFKTNISKVNPSLIKDVICPYADLNPKTIFPSMYEEKFNEKIYEKEAETFLEFLNQYDTIRVRLMEEAKGLLV